MGQFDPNDKKYDGRKQLDEGRYVAIINQIFPKKSATGNQMVVVDFKVIGKAGKGAHSGFEYYLLTDEQAWKFARLCRSCGVDKAFDPESFASLTKLLHNEPIVINVELRDDKDKDGNKIKRPRVVGVEPLTDEDTDDLNALYGDDESWPNADDNTMPKPKDGDNSATRRKPRNDDDDDRPRRKRGDDDDDDDRRPSRKSDSDKPAPKPKSKDDDDDSGSRPRRKKSGFENDDDIPF